MENDKNNILGRTESLGNALHLFISCHVSLVLFCNIWEYWTMCNDLRLQNANNTRQRCRQQRDSSRISLKSLGLIESAFSVSISAGLAHIRTLGSGESLLSIRIRG